MSKVSHGAAKKQHSCYCEWCGVNCNIEMTGVEMRKSTPVVFGYIFSDFSTMISNGNEKHLKKNEVILIILRMHS